MLIRFYRISSGSLFYIGSTTQLLSGRLKTHRHRKQLPLDWNNVRIELIEEGEYETRLMGRQREDALITPCLMDPNCLNKRRAFTTREEDNAHHLRKVECDRCHAMVGIWYVEKHKQTRRCKPTPPHSESKPPSQ